MEIDYNKLEGIPKSLCARVFNLRAKDYIFSRTTPEILTIAKFMATETGDIKVFLPVKFRGKTQLECIAEIKLSMSKTDIERVKKLEKEK